MSTATSLAAPSPTGRCSDLYDTPIRDTACAMAYRKRHIGFMSSCCQRADLVSYYDDCGLYCLAREQTADELTQCLYDAGANWEDVFCRGEGEATATGEGKPIASSDTRVLDQSEQEDAENDDSEDSGSAAPSAAPSMKASVNVIGVVTGSLLFSVLASEILQI